jgi:hypothetical protein
VKLPCARGSSSACRLALPRSRATCARLQACRVLPRRQLPVHAQNCGNIEKAAISSGRPHTLGRHGYDPVRSRLPLLVPFSKPSITGARACRIATSCDRLAPATPSPRLRLLSADRLLWVWLYRVRSQVLDSARGAPRESCASIAEEGRANSARRPEGRTRTRLANLGWASPSVRPGLNIRQGQVPETIPYGQNMETARGTGSYRAATTAT